MGFLILGAMGVYLLVSVGVVLAAIGYARKNGRSAKRWGWGAALVMYLIPFWDWLPTVAVHQYYCATESGFWIYKTFDQWKRENPVGMETLATGHLPADEYRVKPDAWRPNDRKYVLPDATVLAARYNVKHELMYIDFKKPDGRAGYRLNERIYSAGSRIGPVFLHRWKSERTIFDNRTNEVLAKYVDFSTAHEQPQAGWAGWKFWIKNDHCIDGEQNDLNFSQFEALFKGGDK